MRKATENQGNTRTVADFFSSRSKVKDLALQQRSHPHFTSFHQETPMKPSQVPNRLSPPPPRRVLPLQRPELWGKDRPDPHWHPPHPPGPIYSSGFVPSSPTNIGSSINRPHLMPKDRPGPTKHFAQSSAFVPSSPTNTGISANRPQPMPRDKLGPLQNSSQAGPRPYCSSLLVPVSPRNWDPSANRPQPSPPSVFHPASPQFRKNLSNHSPSSHSRRDQMTDSKVTLSNSGSKNETAQRQESHEVQSSNMRSPIQTVQLHRSPMSLMTPSLSTRAVQELHPRPPSDSKRWVPAISQWHSWEYQPSPSTHSSDRSNGYILPVLLSSPAPCQGQQHEQTPSSEKLIQAVDSNCSSLKRHGEFEYSYESSKKLCVQGTDTGETQTTKATAGSSPGTSPVSQLSSKHSSVLERSPQTTDSPLRVEPPCGQSTCSELSSTFKPTQSSCTSLPPKHSTKRPPPMGAKQAYLHSTQNDVVKLSSPTNSGEESVKKRSEENNKREKSGTLSSQVPQRDSRSSPHAEFSSHHSGHTACSTSVLPAKTLSRSHEVGESRKFDSGTPKPASKPNSSSPSCRTVERNKTPRTRRPVVMLEDADELFTPDPMTYVVSSACKTAKPKIEGETTKFPSSEKGCLSGTASSSSPPITGSSCHKNQNATVAGSPHAASSSACNSQISLPTVTLKRVKLENLCPKDKELNSSPIASGRQLQDESVKSDAKHTSLLANSASSCTAATDAAVSEQASTSHCSQSLPQEKQPSERGRKQLNEVDPIDMELDLDLDLSLSLDFDLTHSSHSSEEEQLISLQEMMDRVAKPPDTPDKGAFSEPSTPGHHSCQAKTQPFPSTTKSGIYKNNLDQMLKEINTNKKAKEIETQLLTECKEDLLRIAEYEEAEKNREEGISTEQQEFLQRYSLMSSAIREVPPGEVVFNLEKFGQIFDQDTLQLRQCMVNPQGTAQKTLLWSSPAQLRLHVNIGLFQEAYDYTSPCPTQVTRFLFKMMSVHSERMVSDGILQALCDIACTAACQIVNNRSQNFKVWVPSLADVTLVLMNMGAAFVTLFPFENLQPSFTEGDLLEDVYIKSESPSNNKEQTTFPEHNCNNILKYLSYCMSLCPRAYSDDELLLLLTVVGRVNLDTRLIFQSSVKLYPLQNLIVNNFRDWDTTLPRICLALTDLTDDHHNMCQLVHLLPNNRRGKQLRRHLSLSMISKLLDGNCTYRPRQKEFQLSELRPYLPRMQPSTLLRGMLASSGRSQKDKEQDMATLDQQSYYLCYSLLTLTNEASSFQFFSAHQKEQLLRLSSELEAHVKCDIRESEKCLYRSKVKDLVARIYTKWLMLLQRTRPLHGKLYDYWQPMDTLVSSQEEQEEEEGTLIEEEPVMEDDEEEATITDENDDVMFVEDEEDMKLDENLEEMEVGSTTNDTSEAVEAMEPVPDNLNQVLSEMVAQVVDEQTEASQTQTV